MQHCICIILLLVCLYNTISLLLQGYEQFHNPEDLTSQPEQDHSAIKIDDRLSPHKQEDSPTGEDNRSSPPGNQGREDDPTFPPGKQDSAPPGNLDINSPPPEQDHNQNNSDLTKTKTGATWIY